MVCIRITFFLGSPLTGPLVTVGIVFGIASVFISMLNHHPKDDFANKFHDRPGRFANPGVLRLDWEEGLKQWFDKNRNTFAPNSGIGLDISRRARPKGLIGVLECAADRSGDRAPYNPTMFALDLPHFFIPTARSPRQGCHLPRQSSALALALCGRLAGGTAQALAAEDSQAGPNEPVIQRNVLEDDASRIEETRVRGQIRRITVSPKANSKLSYEIMLGDGSGSESSRSSAGKRVWNVLYF